MNNKQQPNDQNNHTDHSSKGVLSKLASANEVQGADGAQNLSVQQYSIVRAPERRSNSLAEVEFRKNAILPTEGRHVLHLFFKVDQTVWNYFDEEEQEQRIKNLESLVKEIREIPITQLLSFSMVTPKADLGFMMITPDLQTVDIYAKKLEQVLGVGVLIPTFSWLAMTERSEYGMNDEEYAVKLEMEEKLNPSTPEFEEKMQAFRERMAKYVKERLEPQLPLVEEWPVFCFYPMSKRRNPEQNWYALSLSARKELMQGHARVGRSYAGRVKQFISGSTGLDDQEWGVSLFAKTTSDIKAIVYEMRFDEVSVKYAEFGEFFIGIQMEPPALCERLGLSSREEK
ncbi:MAG TPA: chlorite dismutase family protein [Chthoniobacterales bacterium]|nr:chlorite dismutase family protein [Chthoniobacterales bacterium]